MDCGVFGASCLWRPCRLAAAVHEVSNGVSDFRISVLRSVFLGCSSRALELLRFCEDFCGLGSLCSDFFGGSAGRLLMAGALVSTFNGFAPAFDSSDESPLFSVATV